jgi:hypothetical protein
MKSWQTWILIALIGLLMSITVRIIAENTSGHHGEIEELTGKLELLDSRVLKVETRSHPATTKRFTSDDAHRLIDCLRLPYVARSKCLDNVESEIGIVK